VATQLFYICDVCGNQSLNKSNFNTPVLAGAASNLVAVIPSVLLCNPCCTELGAAANVTLTARQGINAGVTLP